MPGHDLKYRGATSMIRSNCCGWVEATRTTIVSRRRQQRRRFTGTTSAAFVPKPTTTRTTRTTSHDWQSLPSFSPPPFVLGPLLSTPTNTPHNDEPEGTAPTTLSETAPYWSLDDLQSYAQHQGVRISVSTLGPGFRAVARAAHNTSLVLGYIEGFGRGRILHLDSMHVYGTSIQQAKAETTTNIISGGSSFLGIGLWLAYASVWHGHVQQSCRTAEFLAIDDAPRQHRRLVRTYQIAGFDTVRYVGDDFASIPDRLVWGGCGTLFRHDDLPHLLTQWTRLLTRRQTEPTTAQSSSSSS